MRKRAIRSARLVALFVLGWILLNYPVLAIFNAPSFVWGVPVLHAYLFAVWSLLILLIVWATRRRGASWTRPAKHPPDMG
jgi:hypothetical protein